MTDAFGFRAVFSVLRQLAAYLPKYVDFRCSPDGAQRRVTLPAE